MLKQRIITAAVLLAILLPALFYPSLVPFACVMLVLIAAACVVRRYHFLADVLTGGVAGVVAFAASRAL